MPYLFAAIPLAFLAAAAAIALGAGIWAAVAVYAVSGTLGTLGLAMLSMIREDAAEAEMGAATLS